MRMRVRSRTQRAPRNAGRNSRLPLRRSANRSPRFATARSRSPANAMRWLRRLRAPSKYCRRRRRCARLPAKRALKERVARIAAALELGSQLVQRFALDLAHALARDADLAGQVFECAHVTTVKPVAA